MNRKNRLPHLLVVLFALLLHGCVTEVKNMRPLSPGQVAAGPAPGKAMVVFLRPSPFGVSIESSLFEVKEGVPVWIGTLVAQQKLAYQLEPGRHLLMVAGRNVEYLQAELKAGKTYYVHISPVMGEWIGRFAIAPIPINELYSTRFRQWLRECDEVARVASGDGMAGDMAAIRAMHRARYDAWMARDHAREPKLLARDGK